METSIDKTVEMGSRSANDNLRANLREYGDNGITQRTVIHYAYPLHGTGTHVRAMLVEELERRGFEVSNAQLRNGVVFRHDASVASPQFDATTAELAELLRSDGWDYDGWECLPPMDASLAYWRQISNIAVR